MRYFEQFGHVNESTRFEVKQRAAVINHDAAEQWLTVQCGKYIRVWRELYGDKEALDRLCCADDDFWPKRLKPLTDSATSGPIPIHKQEPVYVPGFLHFIKTVPSFGLNGENGFA
jgi:phage replication initiation protein